MILTSIKINEKDWEDFKNKLNIGVSRAEKIREWIRDYNKYSATKEAEITKKQLYDKIDKEKEELSKKQEKIIEYERRLENIEKEEEKKREKMQKKQKRMIEQRKKCIECQRKLTDNHKKHKFARGLVCHSCYMAATVEKIREWQK